MQRFLNTVSAVIFLRLGLGLMFLYSGIDIMIHPTAWIWAVRGLPLFIQNIIEGAGIETYLFLQGMSEVVLAIALLAWFLPRKVGAIAGLVAGIEMLAITVMVGLDAVTFRDIGLIGAGFALFVLLSEPQNSASSPPSKGTAPVQSTAPDEIIVETPESIYAKTK